MQNLITPERVAEEAFAQLDYITPDRISPLSIAVAQEKFIEPVFGSAMTARMAAGGYPELLDRYVAPALGLYVHMLMMPMLALRTGAAGVVRAGGQYLDCATDMEVQRNQRVIASQASTLLRKAVSIVEASPEEYPEYDARNNILNRCRIDGGIIL